MLKVRGYRPEDLYKPDIGIEIGSLIYAQARARVAKATGKGSTIDKAKGYAAKGTAEAQAAIDKINKLLK